MCSFHVLSVHILCIFCITHTANQDHIMLQKNINWFVKLFNRTCSSVGIFVFPVIDIQQIFVVLSSDFPGGHFGFFLSAFMTFLNKWKSFTCASFCLICPKAPPFQTYVLSFVKLLFPKSTLCLWIWFCFGCVFCNPWFYLKASLNSIRFLFPVQPEN